MENCNMKMLHGLRKSDMNYVRTMKDKLILKKSLNLTMISFMNDSFNFWTKR
jgi:hypothetical protein